MEFTQGDLKVDFDGAGGNLAPDQLSRIVRSHEPLLAIQRNMEKALGLTARSGKHLRPVDNRVAPLVDLLCSVDPFIYTPNRFYRGHATMPRNILHWLVPSEFTAWVEKRIMKLGTRDRHTENVSHTGVSLLFIRYTPGNWPHDATARHIP